MLGKFFIEYNNNFQIKLCSFEVEYIVQGKIKVSGVKIK